MDSRFQQHAIDGVKSREQLVGFYFSELHPGVKRLNLLSGLRVEQVDLAHVGSQDHFYLN